MQFLPYEICNLCCLFYCCCSFCLVRFVETVHRITNCSAESHKDPGCRHQLVKGWFHFIAPLHEIDKVVYAGKLQVLGDQEAFKELFCALLCMEAGYPWQRTGGSESATGDFQIVVNFVDPVLFRRPYAHKGLPAILGQC